MFCSNCGKEIDGNSRFCKYCGIEFSENNIQIDNTESMNYICSVCGNSYEKDRKYCPNCTADYIPIDKRIDLYKCGYYLQSQNNGKCKYVVHCKQENCIFVKNYQQYENRQNTGCYAKIGLIIIILFITLVSCHNKSNVKVDKPQVESQKYSQETQQNLMKITNNFVIEGQKVGLIKKIDKTCENNKCIYVFWINENIFNQYGYEDRQDAKKLFMEYGKLRGEGGIMRGYYNGKFL